MFAIVGGLVVAWWKLRSTPKEEKSMTAAVVLTLLVSPSGYFYTIGKSGLIRWFLIFLFGMIHAGIVAVLYGLHAGWLVTLITALLMACDNARLVRKYNSGKKLTWRG